MKYSRTWELISTLILTFLAIGIGVRLIFHGGYSQGGRWNSPHPFVEVILLAGVIGLVRCYKLMRSTENR